MSGSRVWYTVITQQKKEKLLSQGAIKTMCHTHKVYSMAICQQHISGFQ